MDLAERLAKTWDAVEQLPTRPRVRVDEPFTLSARPVAKISRLRRDAKRDVRNLETLVEKWSLHSMLVTERPRELWRYRLPYLTAMYRACCRLDRSAVDGSLDGSKAVSVCNSELNLVFCGVGLRRQLRESERVIEWLDELGRRKARPDRAKDVWRQVREEKLDPVFTEGSKRGVVLDALTEATELAEDYKPPARAISGEVVRKMGNMVHVRTLSLRKRHRGSRRLEFPIAVTPPDLHAWIRATGYEVGTTSLVAVTESGMLSPRWLRGLLQVAYGLGRGVVRRLPWLRVRAR
ncbi:hypothetical protein [Amycolatopsis nigrescens]|uniref:hypothetical protein n=1 Tax=Amycolatopsis nigrescens TaxID=381445 RepID=UPI00035C404A|nr:hypothetical protein [Amycolatopsis nigrescens]